MLHFLSDLQLSERYIKHTDSSRPKEKNIAELLHEACPVDGGSCVFQGSTEE